MKVRRCAPLILAPFIFACSNERGIDSKKPGPSQEIVQTDAIKNLSELTSEQKQILDDMVTFLETYTGNGKLNYGSIERVIQGLYEDVDAVHEEAETMEPGLRADAAKNYPNNNFITNALVKREIKQRTRDEIIEDFEKFGVDPETENTPDDSPIEKFITKKELYKYRDNASVYKAIVEKDLNLKPGEKLIFKEGVSIEAIKFGKERKIGLPPGAEIVDNLPN